MDKKDALHEQDAPLKNTDHAFVQVGEDGLPVVPETEKNKPEESQKDSPTDLDKQ